MAVETSKDNQECKCVGDKKVKAMEKQIAELFAKMDELTDKLGASQRKIDTIIKVLSR